MYNPEEKQRYINYKESQAILPNNYLDRLFKDTEGLEYDLRVDVSDWDEPMIIEFYKKRKTPSLQSLIVMNGRLAEYTDFLSRLNGKRTDNKFNNITTDVLKTCIDEEKSKRRFISKNDFYLSLNVLDNAVDKFVMTALFEGIKGKNFEDIWRLELKNISKDSAVLHNNKKIDLMDSNLYYLANESAETYDYYTFGKKETVVRMFGAPDQIIKEVNAKQHLEINDDPVMISRQGKNIFRKFERAANEIGWEEIKPRTLLISGQIEYTKRIAETYKKDIEDVIYDNELFSTVERRFIKISNKEEFVQASRYVSQQSTSSG